MPVGGTGLGEGDGNIVGGTVTGYASGIWIQVNDDARTAQSAADLLNPYAIDDAVFHWVQVPQGAKRFFVRARVDDSLTTVTTDPVFTPIGAWADPAAASSTAATTKMLRLDNADWAAAGLTIDLVTSGVGMHTDGTDFISDIIPTTITVGSGGYPTQGAAFLGIAVGTAAAIAESVAVRVEVLFLE